MNAFKWALAHSYNFACGLYVACIGYFSPVKGVILVMVAAIIIDLIVGILAALKNGEGIKSHKLWRTIYKMLLALITVMLLYAVDKEMQMLSMHKFVAWLITGFEVWSMLENAGKLTNHKLFCILRNVMNDKIKQVTNIDLENETKEQVHTEQGKPSQTRHD